MALLLRVLWCHGLNSTLGLCFEHVAPITVHFGGCEPLGGTVWPMEAHRGLKVALLSGSCQISLLPVDCLHGQPRNAPKVIAGLTPAHHAFLIRAN